MQWRALLKGAPVEPGLAYAYITRALRQTRPHILGALRLLAASYPPAELNRSGFALYTDFRPEVDGWGKRGEIRCDTILALRKQAVPGGVDEAQGNADDKTAKLVPVVMTEEDSGDREDGDGKRLGKKAKTLTVEEYEAALDDDATYEDLAFDEGL